MRGNSAGGGARIFSASTGRRFLEFIYPRFVFGAGVTAASEAARKFHDRRIGKGHVTHLFRLPHTIEQRLRSILLADAGTLPLLIASKESALRELGRIRGKGAATAPEGPIRVGNTTMLVSGSTVAKLAGLYLDAFENSKQTLPYFTAEGNA